jgi:hypothetical protein
VEARAVRDCDLCLDACVFDADVVVRPAQDPPVREGAVALSELEAETLVEAEPLVSLREQFVPLPAGSSSAPQQPLLQPL